MNGSFLSEVIMANKKLTCTFFVGGKPVDELTEEQLDKMAERLGAAMSVYYTAHPDEYAKIKTTGVTK
jgi:hypothetical protein